MSCIRARIVLNNVCSQLKLRMGDNSEGGKATRRLSSIAAHLDPKPRSEIRFDAKAAEVELHDEGRIGVVYLNR
jgi:hypothetical protein